MSSDLSWQWPRVVPPLAVAAGCLLALASTWFLFVWTGAGQRVDQALLAPSAGGGAATHDGVLRGRALELLSALGDPVFLAVSLAAVVALATLRGRAGDGIIGVIVVGVSVVAARSLKQVLSRPDLGVADSSTHNSFPSGHVSAATGLVFAVVLALPAAARVWGALVGAVGVLGVCAATMITGWHRLSDVIGAVLLVVALGCLAIAGGRVVRGSGSPSVRAEQGSCCDTRRDVQGVVDRG